MALQAQVSSAGQQQQQKQQQPEALAAADCCRLPLLRMIVALSHTHVVHYNTLHTLHVERHGRSNMIFV